MPIWTPNPTITTDTFLSRGELRTPQRNAEWIYQQLRAWPGRAHYHHAGGGTFGYAQPDGVLSINYPIGDTYPVYSATIYKTPGRDELVLPMMYRASTSAAHRLDIKINGDPAALPGMAAVESITASATSNTSLIRTYAISGGAHGIVDDDYYHVAVYATNIGTQRQRFTLWVDEPRGRIAGGAQPGGYPTLPTFSGAGSLNPTNANTVMQALTWLYSRIVAHRIPGYSGLITGFMDAANSVENQFIRHFNWSLPIFPGRRTLRLFGRHEGRGAQNYDLQLLVNGSQVWAQSFSGAFTTEPWELAIDISALSLTNGAQARAGMNYRRTSGGHFPRPRVSLFDVALSGADSSGLYAYQQVMPVGTPFDPRDYLQQLRNNVAAAKAMYDAIAGYLECDLPFSHQWDTSARYALHPGVDPNDINRKETNPVNGPASFTRWGDVLHVYGVRPRIVWGPQLYKYEAIRGGDEKVIVEQPYEYTIDDDPDKAVKATIYLDSVNVDGARLYKGQRYRVAADRLYYAAEGVLP